MSSENDLVGLGVPFDLARALGFATQALTAAGNSQGTAAAILADVIEMTATGSDGVILPANALVNTPYFVANVSGSTGLVYVPSGHKLNTVSNGSLSVASHKFALLMQTSPKNWYSILTA